MVWNIKQRDIMYKPHFLIALLCWLTFGDFELLLTDFYEAIEAFLDLASAPLTGVLDFLLSSAFFSFIFLSLADAPPFAFFDGDLAALDLTDAADGR